MTEVVMGLLGATCGLMISGGVFTALLALGLVPRFAGKSHTANHILTYETAVVSGCVMGGVVSVFPVWEYLGNSLYRIKFFDTTVWAVIADICMAGGGFYAGCFVGCLALAIAEMLDSIPIFARRIKFTEGLGIVIVMVAIGKTVGSLLYFALEIYTGGQ